MNAVARPARVIPSRPSNKPPIQSSSPAAKPGSAAPAASKPEPKILFQTFFKSIGPRTYVAQVKEARNGNQFLVLTEGKRDDKNSEVRKTRLFVYSEDFREFFRMVKQTAEFIKANPLPDSVKQKRERYWKRQADGNAKS